jgi:hypothetical protein
MPGLRIQVFNRIGERPLKTIGDKFSNANNVWREATSYCLALNIVREETVIDFVRDLCANKEIQFIEDLPTERKIGFIDEWLVNLKKEIKKG